MNLRLSLAGTQAFVKGSPWIAAEQQLGFRRVPPAGTILRVQDAHADFLGWCVSDGPGLRPAFRVLSRGRHEDFGAAWWAARVEAALARRRALGLPQGPRRWIHAEADGLPGLVVEGAEGVLLCSYASPGVLTFAELVETALLQQLRPRGIWRRDLGPRGWGPWARSPLTPAAPARFSAAEPGVDFVADLEAAALGPGLPHALERRAWRAWSRAEAAGRKVLLLGGLDGEAASARAAAPAELVFAERGIFKALAKAAGGGYECVGLDVPRESKESFGRFNVEKHLPRLLSDLAAACAPGAQILCTGSTRPLWFSQAWEEAWKAARPDAPPVLERVLGPEADFPEHPQWPEGRARKAFLFRLF
jgi:23S rRNA (cytosine1962-C5)-methyltransferase